MTPSPSGHGGGSKNRTITREIRSLFRAALKAITGGRGRLAGTLVGAALLGTIGTALVFLGVNPFWEKAIQGAIILAALASDTVLGRLEHHAWIPPRPGIAGR